MSLSISSTSSWSQASSSSFQPWITGAGSPRAIATFFSTHGAIEGRGRFDGGRTRRRLRTVAHTDTTFGKHSLTPRPPKWNGNPRYAFGNKNAKNSNDNNGSTRNNEIKKQYYNIVTKNNIKVKIIATRLMTVTMIRRMKNSKDKKQKPMTTITSHRVIPTVTSYYYIYLSQILTFFVLKSGEDEKEMIILMKSRALRSLDFIRTVSRFHQNYPLLLVPSPGRRSSSDHCDLSGQTDSDWLSLCLIRNNFKRLGVSRRLGAWELRFERYKNVWLS